MRREPIKPISIETYRTHIERILPEKTSCYLTTVYYRDVDNEYCETGNNVHTERLTRSDILEQVSANYDNEGLILRNRDSHKPCLPHSLSDLYEIIAYHNGSESDGGTAFVESPKVYRKRTEKEERRACEELAGEICRRYKVKPDSIDFIHAARKHYRRIINSERHFRDDPEMRAERYGRCMANGCRDSFFEDNDYSSGLIHDASDKLARLLSYLRKHCPLLMAQYKEQQLRKRRRKEKLS